MIGINKNIKNIVLSHLVLFIIFSLIYYKLFDNITYHFVLNDKITKNEYIENRLINSLYLSANMQFTTGHLDFYFRSSLAKFIGIIHLFLSLIVTIGFIVII